MPEEEIDIQRILDYEKMPTYYANCSMVGSSLYDFQFIFGKFHLDAPKKVVEKYDQIIYMGPHQAKAFFDALKDHLEKYEKNFGEIKIQPPKV